MRHKRVLSLLLLLFLCGTKQGTWSEAGEDDESHCPGGLLAARLSEIVSGGHSRLGFTSIEELPEILKTKWAKAEENKIKFPLGFFGAWARVGIPAADTAILRELSEKRLLSRPGAPQLGWIQEKKIFVEVVSDVKGKKFITRKALVNIKGHRYQIEVEMPLSVAETKGGGYRIDAMPEEENVWAGVVSWEGASAHDQAWIHSRDALGVSVMTSKGKVFTRVEDARFDKIGNGEIWRDEESGLIWSAPIEERMTWPEAKDFCKSLSTKIPPEVDLPTKAMFEDLVQKNGHTLISNQNNRWFWSASVHPDYSDYAFQCYGNSGVIYDVSRDNRDGVRCVASSR